MCQRPEVPGKRHPSQMASWSCVSLGDRTGLCEINDPAVMELRLRAGSVPCPLGMASFGLCQQVEGGLYVPTGEAPGLGGTRSPTQNRTVNEQPGWDSVTEGVCRCVPAEREPAPFLHDRVAPGIKSRLPPGLGISS